MTEIPKVINAGLAFLLELAMLAALGYWGFHGDKNVLAKWMLGIGLPLLAAIVWGIFPCSEGDLSAGQHKRQSSFVDSILAGSHSAVLYTATCVGNRLRIDGSCKSAAHNYLEAMVRGQ